jgi:hypothetical protein
MTLFWLPRYVQLSLWGENRPYPVDRCPDCGRAMYVGERVGSLWGRCRKCENERVHDVCAG